MKRYRHNFQNIDFFSSKLNDLYTAKLSPSKRHIRLRLLPLRRPRPNNKLLTPSRPKSLRVITPGILRIRAHLAELRHAILVRHPHGRIAGRFDGDDEPVASLAGEAYALARVLGGHDEGVADAAVVAVAAEGFDNGVDAGKAFTAGYAVLEGWGC